MYQWKLLFEVRGCHRWYRDLLSGNVSACDQSGELPHLTDDGVLWLEEGQRLDPTRPTIYLRNRRGERVELGGTNEQELAALIDHNLVQQQSFACP